MTQLRAPRITGVAGGVGTTTLALALRGYDWGSGAERGVDVLACRCTGQSLHLAASTVNWLAAHGRPRPVLAVTCDQPGPLRGTCRARLRMMEAQVPGLVVLPYVNHWRELTDPFSEAARLPEQPADRLAKPLRGYAEALNAVTQAVLRSGLLSRPTSATDGTGPIWSTTPMRWAGPAPTRWAGPDHTIEIVDDTRIDADPSTDLLSAPLSRVAAFGGAR